MLLYLTNKSKSFRAIADYDIQVKRFTVKRGSIVSNDIAYSPSFRGSRSIERLRTTYVLNNTVIEDVIFTSSSTAANFITGRSCNGMIMWKDSNGKTLKEILSD